LLVVSSQRSTTASGPWSLGIDYRRLPIEDSLCAPASPREANSFSLEGRLSFAFFASFVEEKRDSSFF
jgi:hypothetical protein